MFAHRLGLAALLCSMPILACNSDEGAPTGELPSATDPTDPTSDGGASDGGKLKAAQQGCKSDDECETGICFIDNQSFCSIRCTKDDALTVCVPPYRTCNKKGYCKPN